MALGYTLVSHIKLDEPVFFQHYYDQRVYIDNRYHNQDNPFNLQYITNVDDDRVVMAVEFLEYPELNIKVTEEQFSHSFNWGYGQDNTPGETYGWYSVRTVYCQITDFPEEKGLDGVVLTQAKILFDDFSEKTVDIGEIHLYESELGERLLSQVSASSSSYGTSSSRYKVLEDISLVTIVSPLMEKFQDRVELEVNGSNSVDIAKISLQKGNFLEVISKVGPPTEEDIVSQYTLFNIHPKLIFTDVDGNDHDQRFYNINSIYHNYTFIDLYRYVKAREAI
ncbi:hypothetical protein EDC19_1722 [Natranaerovirga hydrolytica]|uniref:Uncharacterized protein n=2 Tax=Natranaerovirga hydrolytica TaxID=680378 RepID=A0A4R1MRN7_9FIRM|nr:hypothetical protein EDC19_1722 [Natranaerovirga hydrolytica]